MIRAMNGGMIKLFLNNLRFKGEVRILKATQLIEELQKLVKEHGLDIDVQTFSNQIGVYKEIEEIDRIWINN